MKMSKLIEEGRAFDTPQWVNYGADFKVQLRAIGNVDYEIALTRHLSGSGARSRRRRADPSDEGLRYAIKRAMAEHVLVGWTGLEDDDGNAIPHSPEKALELFNENHGFFTSIRDLATELQVTMSENEEADEGN